MRTSTSSSATAARGCRARATESPSTRYCTGIPLASHERLERRPIRVRTRPASSSVGAAGSGTSCRRGGAQSRRPLSYPVRSPARRPVRDPCPTVGGHDVPHGGTPFMRRRVSAQLAFGHTPARPFLEEGRAFLHSAARTTVRATVSFGQLACRSPERQRLPTHSYPTQASAAPSGATPVVAYRHSATSSLRARAMMNTRRIRSPDAPARARNHFESALSG